MKHGSFKAVCLIFMASIAVASIFSDENTVDLQSRTLESFKSDSEYEWRVVASKFATKNDEETFPKVALVSAWPVALFGYSPEEEQQSLGIWGKFDRRGYNWIDIYPVAAGADEEAEPAEIPIPGRVKFLNLWVWGSNLNYYLEAYVRDYQGIPHVINMGNIDYTGWKNLRVPVPGNIPQAKKVLPHLESLKFVKFRLWTRPNEPVDNFYVYIDHFKVLTDTFESLYDGNDLGNPEKIQELWNQ